MREQLASVFLSPFQGVDIREIVAASMAQHHADMEELNRRQLEAGTDATGQAIKPFYRRVTIAIKKAKGQPTDKVTLRDKGDFYRGIRAERQGDNMVMDSTDAKSADLQLRYGPAIIGLSVASLSQIAERVRPTIQTKFMQAL